MRAIEATFSMRRVCAVDKASNIQAMLGTEMVRSILEVGCGTGVILAELEKRRIGTSYKGIDLIAPGTHVYPGAAH